MSLQAVFGRIEQRLTALGLTERSASIRAGLNEDAIRSIRRAVETGDLGRVGITSRTLEALANVLGTTSTWLLTGQDDLAGASDAGLAGLPLIGWKDAALYADPAKVCPTDNPADLFGISPKGDYFVLRVEDGSMDRVSPTGALIVVDRLDRQMVEGRHYVGVWEGEVLYRQWWAKPYRAEPNSTNATFKTCFITKSAPWKIIGRVRLSVLNI
jgi:SOS-response transcriptional repressor LexA